MSPNDSQKNSEKILDVLRSHPEGASISEIVEELTYQIPKRTVQRRLNERIEEGDIEKTGEGPAVRYKMKVPPGAEPSISNEAEVIKATVSQPLAQRKPVGYRREFLESYIPNSTYYLSDNARGHLKKIGSQPDGEHPAGTFARNILDRLSIELSWNSSRLEGNTYSLLETQRLILYNDDSSEKNYFETQMILNHKNAISFLVDHADDIDFNPMTICNLHAFLANNLLANPAAIGRLRTIPVGIGKTVYQPTAIPQVLDECFREILQKARQITDPFEQAFFAMVHLPYLQPFEDVNKRVSRLAVNIPFIKNNLSPLSFVDVSQDTYISGLLGIYELNKVALMVDVFVWAYERSAYRYSNIRQTLGEPDKFKMQHGTALAKMMHDVVTRAMTKAQATTYLQRWASEQIENRDQTQFVGMVEDELLALHPGSIFRFGITLTQFQKWQIEWNQEKS